MRLDEMYNQQRLENLEAWAAQHGYGAGFDYTKTAADSDPVLPPVTPKKPGQLSPHFNEDEFRCRCCGELPSSGIDKKLIDVLEATRAHFGGKVVTVNSGYRCPSHNAAVGGATNSQHLYGRAADITIRGVPNDKVWSYLNNTVSSGGVGRYNTFTHVDTRGTKARWDGR